MKQPFIEKTSSGMDVFFHMGVFRMYPGLIFSFEHKSAPRKLLQLRVFVGILDYLYVRWTKNLKLVEPLFTVTRSWSSYFVIFKFSINMQCFMMLLEQFGQIVVRAVATVT